jgi:hypothetical protein
VAVFVAAAFFEDGFTAGAAAFADERTKRT